VIVDCGVGTDGVGVAVGGVFVEFTEIFVVGCEEAVEGGFVYCGGGGGAGAFFGVVDGAC